MALAFKPDLAARQATKLRFLAVSWAGLGGLVALVWTFFSHLMMGGENPPGLIALLTPANLFTGVLACGLICLLATWADRRFLPAGLRPGPFFATLNVCAGIFFLALGVKGYWDHSDWTAFLILAATLAVGWVGAWMGERWFFKL